MNGTRALADEPTQEISVIIPHLNQPVMLERCLKSLMAGQRCPDQVLVIDNGSNQSLERISALYPKVEFYQELAPGPGPARNLGVAKAKGSILAFTDADCIVSPSWLLAIEKAFADPAVQIIGGDVRISCSNSEKPNLLEAYESVYAFRMERYIKLEGYAATLNLACRKSTFDKVGPFAGLSVAEDRDWGQRARALGISTIYRPEMLILHPARSRFQDLKQKWDRRIAHDFVEARRNIRGRVLWTVKALALGISPLWEWPKIVVSNRLIDFRSRLLAIVGLVRIRIYRSRVMLWLQFGGDPECLSSAWNRKK